MLCLKKAPSEYLRGKHKILPLTFLFSIFLHLTFLLPIFLYLVTASCNHGMCYVLCQQPVAINKSLSVRTCSMRPVLFRSLFTQETSSSISLSTFIGIHVKAILDLPLYVSSLVLKSKRHICLWQKEIFSPKLHS